MDKLNKEKVVIIGANDFQNKLIETAKSKGYETHVFAWECGDIGERTADYFYPISITEKEEILEKCKELRPVGICSIASDLAVPTVNYIAEKLNLVGNDEVCSLIATDKYEMRKAFMENELPTPKFYLSDFDNNIPSDMEYPLIVKPTDRSGSRGVSKIYSSTELSAAIEYAKDVSFAKKVIIEEFIEGNEYSIEYISYRGRYYFLAATKKFTTGSPHFVELAHYQPSDLTPDVLSDIKTMLERAFEVLHIRNGAVHAEVMVKEDGSVRIIEIGARMGGDCIGSDLVQLSTGYDYVEMVLDISCGKTPSFKKKNDPKIAFIKFIMTYNDTINFNKVRKEFGRNVQEINFDLEVPVNVSVISSAERVGYYIMTLDSNDDLGRVCKLTEII